MKAEINSENKVRFFAQYWGQKVFLNSMIETSEPVNNIYLFNHIDPEDIDFECLLLKPLSSISDEDAIDVAILGGCNERCSLEYKLCLGKCRTNKNHSLGKNVFTQLETDYLRSKGYALPWMGLSVEEMVEAGWIKLV